MAYVDIGAKSPGGYVESTYLNQVRANFQAGVPDIFVTKGDIAVATAADAATRLAVGADDATLVPDASTASGLAWQIQPACRVYTTGAILMVQETWTAIGFDAESFDTDALHSISSNNSRITIPTGGAGIIQFGFNANASRVSDNTSSWKARVLLNGATEIAQFQSTSSRPAYINMSGCYAMSAADYIEVQYYSGSVVDQNIAAGAYFWAIWQRRA